MKTSSLTAAVAALLSVATAAPASTTTAAPTCTVTAFPGPFQTVKYASTLTQTAFTACHGCALMTQHLGVGPVVTKTTSATLTTTVTKCSTPAAKLSDCTFSTAVPFTLSVPTCYQKYTTKTVGIDCQGCRSYRNIAGLGPVRACGTTVSSATGTATALQCAS